MKQTLVLEGLNPTLCVKFTGKLGSKADDLVKGIGLLCCFVLAFILAPSSDPPDSSPHQRLDRGSDPSA